LSTSSATTNEGRLLFATGVLRDSSPNRLHPPATPPIPYTLPTETLTFLFTDIEGSTVLLGRLGHAAYSKVLADHHRLIRAGLASHDGKEIDTQGDGFFAVFSSPSACVAAVIEMQRALGAHEWPDGERVRVRMGVHSGEASETETGLVGIDVHRAARVGAVAHGGQIVLSAAAAALVRDSLPSDASLRDLGRHRLKDLGRPEQIFQLGGEGLEVDFLPLRSLDNPALANNLPAQSAHFVGRDREVAEVRRLVESARLVTLTGAGGSGKTRLGLQVAAELLDGTGDAAGWSSSLRSRTPTPWPRRSTRCSGSPARPVGPHSRPCSTPWFLSTCSSCSTTAST
jgi:class 3 adenylate cyclase